MTPRGPSSRRSRRTLAVAAGGLATVLVLAACGSGADSGPGSGADSGGPAALTLQTWGDTKYATSQFDIYRSAFPKDAQGTSLKVLSAGQSDADAVTKLRLQLSSNKDIPDIVELNYSEVPEFANAGVLADLSSYLQPYLGAVSTAARKLSQYDGKTVAVPYEVKEKLWFYRKDMFQQAGIDPATVRTQDQFVAAGKKLQAKYPKSYLWNIAANPQQYQWGMIMSGNGAAYSTQSPCAITVGSDAGVARTFSAMKTLRDSGVVDTKFDDFSTDWQSSLANGTLASTLMASWFPTFLQQYAPKLAGKWGVTTWPEIGGAVGGSEAAGSVFVIPEASKHKAAAATFLAKTLMTSQGAKPYALKFGYIPNVIALQSDPAITNNAYFGPDLLQAYKAADPQYKIFPYDPTFNKEQTALGSALTSYLTGTATSPAAALATAQQQLQSQVGCPYAK